MIKPINPTLNKPLYQTHAMPGGRGYFKSLIQRGPDANLTGTQAQRREKLREQAGRLVSQTFFGTLLKQARSGTFKSDVLTGGRGAEAFGPLMDQALADRMARSAGRRLVDSIARGIERRSGRMMADDVPVKGAARVPSL
jgi:hypothetical protein